MPEAPSYFTPTYPKPELPDEVVQRILASCAPYSMVHPSGVEFFLHETVRLIRAGVSGRIVECGVWRGGAALASLLAQRAAFGAVRRPVMMLDSFEGLPKVTAKDGPLAQDYQASVDADRYLDNCRADEGALRALIEEHGFTPDEAIVVKGWFADTLPDAAKACAEDGGVAILRLDGDWYDSTLECLTALEPPTSVEGTVIIDDYYAWDGCARAVHDYISRNDLPYRLKSLYNNYGMYFVKRPHRDSYEVF